MKKLFFCLFNLLFLIFLEGCSQKEKKTTLPHPQNEKIHQIFILHSPKAPLPCGFHTSLKQLPHFEKRLSSRIILTDEENYFTNYENKLNEKADLLIHTPLKKQIDLSKFKSSYLLQEKKESLKPSIHFSNESLKLSLSKICSAINCQWGESLKKCYPNLKQNSSGPLMDFHNSQAASIQIKINWEHILFSLLHKKPKSLNMNLKQNTIHLDYDKKLKKDLQPLLLEMLM